MEKVGKTANNATIYFKASRMQVWYCDEASNLKQAKSR